MERKNYLTEKLSNEEKSYLKGIVKTARNKYIEKNRKHFETKSINTEFISNYDGESLVDEIIRRCEEQISSALEFEIFLSDPKLYKVVKALSLKEKEVLFYLYKNKENISSISRIMNLDKKTVRKLRNGAQKKIAENLLRGDDLYV